jgi:hypothetical protein
MFRLNPAKIGGVEPFLATGPWEFDSPYPHQKNLTTVRFFC